MSQVWIVTQGQYSDRHIIAVCSTRENAQLIIDAVVASDTDKAYDLPRVEAWDLDRGVGELALHLTLYSVIMERNGDTRFIGVTENWGAPLQYEDLTTNHSFTHTSDGVVLGATVWAQDVHHAVKIVNELRGQLIAEEKWPT